MFDRFIWVARRLQKPLSHGPLAGSVSATTFGADTVTIEEEKESTMSNINSRQVSTRVRRAIVGLGLSLGLGLLATTVQADEGRWSSWRGFDSELVSVSFSQVERDTWTWKFRNDGGQTITYMKFQYTDKDGSHSDVLPVDLKPHAVHGGWASFTASSNPTIRILELKRK